MKLSFPLLAAAYHAEELSSVDIIPYLDQLESYCNKTYGLPAYATGKLTPERFATKWTNRKGIDSEKTVLSVSFLTIFQFNTRTVFYNHVSGIEIIMMISCRKLYKDASSNAIDFKGFTTENRKKEKIVGPTIRKCENSDNF